MMAQSKCSNQRPDTLMQDRICQIDETSCNARPDHTFGSKLTLRKCQLLADTVGKVENREAPPASRSARLNPDRSTTFLTVGYPVSEPTKGKSRLISP